MGTHLDFPAAPATNDKYPVAPAAGQPQYTWDGEKWTMVGTMPSSFVLKAGDTMTGPLVLPADPTAALQAATKQYVDAHAPAGPPLNGFIFGCTLTINTAAATQFQITYGFCTGKKYADNTMAIMSSPSGIRKTLAAFAEGANNGGVVGGAIAANTWYYAFMAMKADGTTDAFLSTDNTGATLPPGFVYTRRVGACLTDATAALNKQTQFGDYFYWSTPKMDKLLTAHNSWAEQWPVSVPNMYGVTGFGSVSMQTTAAGGAAHLLFSPLFMDYVSSFPDDGSVLPIVSCGASGRGVGTWQMPLANSSITSQHSTTNADTVRIWTRGWIDVRGTKDFNL
jgi:hypothetical protein